MNNVRLAYLWVFCTGEIHLLEWDTVEDLLDGDFHPLAVRGVCSAESQSVKAEGGSKGVKGGRSSVQGICSSSMIFAGTCRDDRAALIASRIRWTTSLESFASLGLTNRTLWRGSSQPHPNHSEEILDPR